MKIAVIAASGRSGRAFVTAALDAGHSVVAGVHSHNPFVNHPQLTVLSCDATKSSDIAQLLSGCDAVVSLIGHGQRSSPSVQTDAIRVICEMMKTQKIHRLISLTGTRVRLESDHVTLIDKILNFSIAHIDPLRIADGIAHAEVIKDSGLDWSILRVLKLQNTRLKPFRLTTHGPTKVITSRAEVAQAILQLLNNNSYIHAMPIISKP